LRIAVVGSGIAGLGAAWALSRVHDVTVFEAAPRLGGHANTLEVEAAGRRIAVDTGFIVYNPVNYPHLIRLFERLDVPTEASNMSFGVSLGHGRLEYAGSPKGLLAQPANLLKPSYWAMVRDLLRFYREAPALLALDPEDPAAMEELGAYLDRNGYGAAFVYDHLLPMAAAIWSCPIDRVRGFPARSFVRFLDNHGLMLLLRGRPQWRTVTGGSREYVRRIVAEVGAERFHTNAPVTGLSRDPDGVTLETPAGAARFDEVVIAAHGDQALEILGARATANERTVLGAFRYEANDAWLHSDARLMPRRRAVWSSWNYLGNGRRDAGAKVSVTYWMNKLQNLAGPELFVSLNPLAEPDPAKVHARLTYDHPIFDAPAIAAQARLPHIQGAHRTWFCGSYCGYGFHEDGLEAGLAVAEALGAPVPWADAVTPASPAARCTDGAARAARAVAAE
jgi:hypothetical protein